QTLTNNATHRGSVLAEVKINRVMEHSDDFEGTIVFNAMGIKHLKQHAQLDFNELCQSLEKLGMVEPDARFTPNKVKDLGLSSSRTTRLTLKPIDELRSDMITTKNSILVNDSEKTEGQTEILNQNNADSEFNINKILEASAQYEEDYSAYFDRT
ncbi:hypothetical protein U2439_28980, partial [Klebsiella pneumoniae]